MLHAGDTVPALSGVDQDGHLVRTGDARGHWLVVFFYPKDGSPGCTTEACAFRDAWTEYTTHDVRVLGISTDDQATHAAFARDHELPFPLVADPSGAWGRAFGIGEGVMGYPRVTFLVDTQGRVAKAYPNVDPGVHAHAILADVGAAAH
jgi:peroxiredoxin Q/BCP